MFKPCFNIFHLLLPTFDLTVKTNDCWKFNNNLTKSFRKWAKNYTSQSATKENNTKFLWLMYTKCTRSISLNDHLSHAMRQCTLQQVQQNSRKWLMLNLNPSHSSDDEAKEHGRLWLYFWFFILFNFVIYNVSFIKINEWFCIIFVSDSFSCLINFT